MFSNGQYRKSSQHVFLQPAMATLFVIRTNAYGRAAINQTARQLPHQRFLRFNNTFAQHSNTDNETSTLNACRFSL
jgi:glycerol-3-phosphate O-acyltransferase